MAGYITHKDLTDIGMEYNSLIPMSEATTIVDYFAQGKSEREVINLIKINDKPITLSLVNTVYDQIRLIEGTCLRLVDGSSKLFIPVELEDGSFTTPPTLPVTLDELKTLLAQIINVDSHKFINIYDVQDVSELLPIINHVVDNIILAQNGGIGTWDDYYNAITQ